MDLNPDLNLDFVSDASSKSLGEIQIIVEIK